MIGNSRSLLALICAAMLTTPSMAQVAGGMGFSQTPTQMAPADRVRAALNQAGITTCAPMIEKAAKFLFENGDGDFKLQPLGPDMNRWPIVMTMESNHAGPGSTRLTIVTIAPAGSCSGSYEQIITWAEKCDVLKSTVFAAYGDPKMLYRNVKQWELNPGNQLYLMAVGTGCVSVKKELIA